MDMIFGWISDKILLRAGIVLKYMSEASIDLFNNKIVDSVLQLFEYMGWILLAVGILFAIVNVYIEYLENESINVHLLVLNIFKGLIAILFLKAGAVRIFELSTTINDLVCKITSTPNYDTSLKNVSTGVGAMNVGVLWNLIIGLVVVLSVIFCLVQIMKRSGMYLAHIMVGYLYLFSIPSGNTDGFMEWCRQTVAIALTNILQTALLYIGLSLMGNDITKIFLGIGVIMAAGKVEDIAGRYGMATGAGRSFQGAGKALGGFRSAGGGTGAGASGFASGASQGTNLL